MIPPQSFTLLEPSRRNAFDDHWRRQGMNLIQSRSTLSCPADRAARFRLSPLGAKLTRGLGIVLALSGTTTIAVPADRLQLAQKMAQDSSGVSAPLPPERPAALAPTTQPAPAAPAHIAPQPGDTQANTAAPQKASDEPIDNTRFNGGPGTMLKLPPASHARMHQCAVEWQNRKMAGTAVEKIWFDFARKCLTR